jgi:hypothetical protein
MNMNAKNNMKCYGIKISGINTSWLDEDNLDTCAQTSSTVK